MQSITKHVIALLAVVGTVACASDRSTAPPADVQSAGAKQTTGTLTLTCSFPTTQQDARAFFASQKDTIFSIIGTMRKAYSSGGAVAATSSGFDALARIAVARGTSAQGGTAANGNALTRDLLACMSVGPVPDSVDFTAALSSGVYEVRGNVPGAGAALAYLASAGQRTAASPVWGVESVEGWGARFNGVATRFLVYGAPLPVNTFTQEPASIDPNNVAYTGFDISVIPAMPGLALVDGNGGAGHLRVGICIDPSGASVANRLLHSGASTTILALQSLSFCSGIVSNQSVNAGHSLLASLARSAFDFIAPAPAHAFAFGGVGGIPSGLSPFGPVRFAVQNLPLAFVQQPSRGSINTAITPAVTVFAATPSGTPVEGVTVTLSIVNNQGINAALAGNTAVTDQSGIATFTNLTVNKAGGYTLIATGSLGGGTTLSATSALFNISGP